MDRIIFHIDVNSAFLSWTAVERLIHGETLDIRTIPSIIGGDSSNRHGIVLAKSIPAKKFHIQTGEPVASALRKCPNLLILPPDHHMYHEKSRRLMELLHSYTDDIEQLSVDECFLDFTPLASRYESPLAAAEQIKDDIKNRFGFTVNIGIAPNKLLAKMASDFTKPDRIHTLFPQEIPAKMWPLPVEDLYMVGRSSASRLRALGIRTIGELAATDIAYLRQEFKSHGQLMWEYANGIGSDQVHSTEHESKGIGNSTTLAKDAVTREDACAVLLTLTESVSARLRKARMLAGSITVEIKYSDFTSCSHQGAPASATNTTNAIYDMACILFDELWNGAPIRLLGIRGTKLMPADAPVQLSLFDLDTPAEAALSRHGSSSQTSLRKPSAQKLAQMDAAVDAIRSRYGEHSLVRGSILSKTSPEKKHSSTDRNTASENENDRL